MTERTYPTTLTGPNGERQVFNRAEDVPPGWTDGLHASVRRGPDGAVIQPPPPPPPQRQPELKTVEPTASETAEKAAADLRYENDIERDKARVIEDSNARGREDPAAKRAAEHAPLPPGWRDLSGPDMLKLAHDRGAGHRVVSKAEAIRYLEGL